MYSSKSVQFNHRAGVGIATQFERISRMRTPDVKRAERTIVILAAVVVVVAISMVVSEARPPQPKAPITPTLASQSGEWELVFSDEFDGDELDTDKWVTCYWWDYNGCKNGNTQELQWYLPDNIRVSDGTLKLVAQEQTVDASDGNTYDYTSGMITTGNDDDESPFPPKFAMQYGYVEVRAKVPAGQGLWPAIWMLPTDFTSKPEFDILEILGHETDTIYMSVHYLDKEGERARDRAIWHGPDFSQDWHTFALDWQPDSLTWYVDGVEHWTYPNASHVSEKDMYLLINLAVGGDWPGDPDSSTPFPSAFEIDYVRIWQRVP